MGPDELPVWQLQVSSHQPHEAPAMQAEQSVEEAQGSAAVQEVHIQSVQ